MRIINYLFAAFLILLFNACKEEFHDDDPRLAFIQELITNPELNLVSTEDVILSETEVHLPTLLPEERIDEVDFLQAVLEEPDRDFLISQLRQRESFTTSPLQKKDIAILSVKLLSQIPLKDFLHQQGIKGFYSVSMPVFNKDNTRAYVKLSYLCEPLCGAGQELVLIRKDDEWKIGKELGIWVN